MTIIKLIIPIYAIVFLGWWLEHRGSYTLEVNKFISFITYRIMLPLSIFMKISTAEMGITRQTLIFYGIVFSQLIIYFIVFQKSCKEKGFEYFVNSVRGNSIYLGFPVMMQLLPAEMLPIGMVLASALSPLTIFGIEILYGFNGYKRDNSQIRKASFLRNPLIQGLLLGLVCNYFNIWHPLLDNIISEITKPVMFLSLLIVGANFNTKSLKQADLSFKTLLILFNKIVLLPLIFFLAAWMFKFDSTYTAIGVILFSTPGAVSNYVILTELREATDLTVNVTILGTAAYLLLLPVIGHVVQLLL